MDWQAMKDWVVWVYTESYKGRIGRLDYLKQRILLFASALVLGLLGMLLVMAESVIVLAVYVLAVIPVWFTLVYRGITLDIQRLHDMGLSGWWVLLVFGLSLIPGLGAIAGIVAIIVFFLVPGTDGPNRFDSTPVKVRPLPTPPSKSFAQLVQRDVAASAKPAPKPTPKAKAKKKAVAKAPAKKAAPKGKNVSKTKRGGRG